MMFKVAITLAAALVATVTARPSGSGSLPLVDGSGSHAHTTDLPSISGSGSAISGSSSTSSGSSATTGLCDTFTCGADGTGKCPPCTGSGSNSGSIPTSGSGSAASASGSVGMDDNFSGDNFSGSTSGSIPTIGSGSSGSSPTVDGIPTMNTGPGSFTASGSAANASGSVGTDDNFSGSTSGSIPPIGSGSVASASGSVGMDDNFSGSTSGSIPPIGSGSATSASGSVSTDDIFSGSAVSGASGSSGSSSSSSSGSYSGSVSGSASGSASGSSSGSSSTTDAPTTSTGLDVTIGPISADGKENVGDAAAVGSNAGTLLRATGQDSANTGANNASAGASAASVVAVVCAAIIFIGAVVYTRRGHKDEQAADADDIDLEGGTASTFVDGPGAPRVAGAAAGGLPLVDGSPRNLEGLENPAYNEQPLTIVRGSVYRRGSNVSISSIGDVAAHLASYSEPTYEAPADGIMGIAQQPLYAEAGATNLVDYEAPADGIMGIAQQPLYAEAGATNLVDYDVAAATAQHGCASTYEYAANM